MTKMISREDLRKRFVEVTSEFAVTLAERVSDGVERGEATDLDRVLRRELLALGDALLAEAGAELGRATLRERESVACPRCREPMRFKQHRPVIVRGGTTGRGVQVSAPYFVCDGCHAGATPLRHELGLDEDGFTPMLREMSVLAGTVEPFEEAASVLLEQLAGVSVSGSRIHTLCQKAGEAAAALAAEGALGKPRRLRPGEKLYVEIDGGMLRIDNEWREAKVGICFPSGDRVAVSKKRRALAHRRVCATLGTREELGALVLSMVTPYLPQTPDGAPVIAGNVVVLADGSDWIANLVEEDLPGAVMILDWYHAAEHVAEAALALFPDDEKARKRWTGQQLGQLRRGRLDVLFRRLAETELSLAPRSAARESVAGLRKYLEKRRAHLIYAKARNEGLLIGSGAVESAIGHVLQQRMKRSGMRWKTPGALAMIGLRCAYRSSDGLRDLNQHLRRVAS
jgi:hypothetical protein